MKKEIREIVVIVILNICIILGLNGCITPQTREGRTDTKEEKASSEEALLVFQVGDVPVVKTYQEANPDVFFECENL